MQQLTANVLVETQRKGANHGIVTTSDGLVLIDTPHKPSDAVRLRAELERRGRPRYEQRRVRRQLDGVHRQISDGRGARRHGAACNAVKRGQSVRLRDRGGNPQAELKQEKALGRSNRAKGTDINPCGLIPRSLLRFKSDVGWLSGSETHHLRAVGIGDAPPPTLRSHVTFIRYPATCGGVLQFGFNDALT